MTFSEYCLAVAEHVSGADYAQNMDVRLYVDGRQPSNIGEQLLFRHLNENFAHLDSDTLRGSYLTLCPKEMPPNTVPLCVIPMEPLYADFRDEGWEPLDHVIRMRMGDIVGRSMNVISKLGDYDEIRHLLILRSIFPARDAEDAKDVAMRGMGDMALALYLAIRRTGGHTLVGISQDIMEREWKLSFEQVFLAAMENTARLFPPRLHLSPLACLEPSAESGVFMEESGKEINVPEIPPHISPLFLSTFPDALGSVAPFYPGVKERLSEMFGGGFYATYGTRNLVLLYPGSTDPSEPRNVLRAFSRANPQEPLTKQVFYYNPETTLYEIV